MSIKAYVVSDDEYCVIEFSEHRATAQRRGANELNAEFNEVRCRRAPEFDAWAERRKVPWRVLIDDHDWSQECGWCSARVCKDDADRIHDDKDQVFCNAEHHEKQRAHWEHFTGAPGQ